MAGKSKRTTTSKSSEMDNQNMINISCIWMIGNFSFVNEKISSQIFEDKNVKLKWIMDLYPNGTDYRNYVALYIRFLNPLDSENLFIFRFSLLDRENKVVFQGKWSKIAKLNQNSSLGFDKYVKKTELLLKNYLSDDTLTIFCDIRVRNDNFEHCSNDNNNDNQFIHHSKFDDLELRSSDKTDCLCDLGIKCDIALVIDGKKLFAHKFVLSSHSNFFKYLIQNNASEGTDLHTIEINMFSYEVMLEVLRYIYTGKVENVKSNTIDLLAAATRYDLTGLKLMCEDCLVNEINVFNVASLLSTADTYMTYKLKEKAVEFIVTHMPEVVVTPGYKVLSTSNPELISEIYYVMQNAPDWTNDLLLMNMPINNEYPLQRVIVETNALPIVPEITTSVMPMMSTTHPLDSYTEVETCSSSKLPVKARKRKYQDYY